MYTEKLRMCPGVGLEGGNTTLLLIVDTDHVAQASKFYTMHVAIALELYRKVLIPCGISYDSEKKRGLLGFKFYIFSLV